MKGLIVKNAYWNAEAVAHQTTRIKTELENLGATADIKSADELKVYMDGKVQGVSGYDFCVYLDKDKYLSQMLEASGLRLYNSHAAVGLCDDKMTTQIALRGAGIAMPRTVAGLLCYRPEATPSKAHADWVGELLGYPLVVKESYGSQGKSVHLASTNEELYSLMAALKMKPHIYQKYIAQSAGRDIRVIVVGGRVLGGMLRQSSGDFRSNIDLGGRGKHIYLSPQHITAAQNIAATLKLDYCGIDFFDTPQPLLCEVNSNAFFTEFEKTTQLNVAKEYAKHILDR